jgi:iron complex outermembrane receptor protein
MKSDTLWPQTYFDLRPLVPMPLSLPTNNFRIKNDTDAVYTQGTYDLGSLTMSKTWLHGRRAIYLGGREIEQLPRQMPCAANQSKTFEDQAGRSDSVSGYAERLHYIKHRGSFRSGGFNGSACPSTPLLRQRQYLRF